VAAERLLQSGVDATLNIKRITIAGLFELAKGSTSTRTLLTLSRVPQVVLIFLTDAMAGLEVPLNIFTFWHFDVSNVAIRYDGKNYPADTKESFIRLLSADTKGVLGAHEW